MRAALAGVLLFALAAVAGAAADLEPSYAKLGRLIVAPFDHAPFPHPARAAGHTYQGKHYPAAEHYVDNSVAVFIPHGFRETDRIDVVVHFHGWHNSVAGTLKTFRLIEQLVASGKNAVLVVPEGPRNAPDSFGGKLEEPGGFQRFLAEVVKTLREREVFRSSDFSVGRIILSGHSGGYRVITRILDHGGRDRNADEVWLFDGLYGQLASYRRWAEETRGRLLVIYTDDGGTKDETEKLRAGLVATGASLYATEESALLPERLAKHQFGIIHTELGHNDVLDKRDQFSLFLRTSCLADRKMRPPN